MIDVRTEQKQQNQAFWYCVIAILLISPDSILIRLSGMEPMVVAFWRSLFSMTACFIFVVLQQRYAKKSGNPRPVIRFRPIMLVMGMVSALGQTVFVFAISETTVANTLIVVAAMPTVFAIIMSRLLLGHKTKLPTYMAMVACISGVLVLTVQDLNYNDITGIQWAILNSFCMATFLTLVRKYPNIDMVVSYIIASAIASITLFILNYGDVIPVATWQQWGFVVCVGFIVQGGFCIMASKGGKYTPPPVFSLLFLLETVLGITGAVIFLNESLDIYTVTGASIVLITLGLHSMWHLKTIRKTTSFI